MTDAPPENKTDVPKTAADLKIEALEADLKSLREQMANDLQVYRDANRELWAQLHPAKQGPPAGQDTPAGQNPPAAKVPPQSDIYQDFLTNLKG